MQRESVGQESSSKVLFPEPLSIPAVPVAEWYLECIERSIPTFEGAACNGKRESKAVNREGLILTVGSRSHRSGMLPVFMWSILIMSLGALPAAGQQANQLQQQIEELKQEYETTNQALQLRIAALEQQVERQSETSDKAKEATVSAAALAAENAAKSVMGSPGQVGGKFQGQLAQEPTYDFLREADVKISKLQEKVSAFEFHGYFRSGYGLNSEGGQQVAFEAPGAGAKYRLGNEAETYGEFIFVNNWVNPNQSSDSAWAKTEVMIEANTTNSASYANFANGVGNDQFRLR
jgi:hypothetical protein